MGFWKLAFFKKKFLSQTFDIPLRLYDFEALYLKVKRSEGSNFWKPKWSGYNWPYINFSASENFSRGNYKLQQFENVENFWANCYISVA